MTPLLAGDTIEGFRTMLLEGKTGLVMGIANKRSIALAIAESARRAGARLVLT